IRNVNSYLIDADRPGSEQKPQPLPGDAPPGFIAWDWSADGAYLAGWQHQAGWGILVYSVATQRYERLNKIGHFPVWLNDGKRLIFREGGDLYLLDRQAGTAEQIYSLKPPNQIGTHVLSRDNRR